MNINFANKFNMTIFWWSINRVWKFVYYGMHVLVCILHNVVHHFIREKSLIQEDGFFIYLAAPEGQGFFVHIFSSSFMDLFVFICFPIHFYLFLGVSIFKTMLSLWWCVTIIVIIWNIIRSFDLLFLLNCCRVFRFIWCFHFENIFHINIYFFNLFFFFHLLLSFNFLFDLGHISFIFCHIVITHTLQFKAIIYIIFIMSWFPRKDFSPLSTISFIIFWDFLMFCQLVKSTVGTKFRRSHVCLHFPERNRLRQLMALLFFVMLW